MLDLTTLSEAVTSATTVALGPWQDSVQWMLVLGFVIAFILAFAVGANDVANSFGTTVGAGTLTLYQACVLASIFETLGAILLGAKVGETIRKGILDLELYKGESSLLMLGFLSAMAASGFWQLIATFLKLPVSGTHSIVGSTVGFSLVAKGVKGISWMKLGSIVGSWFISPLAAGIAAGLFYVGLRKLVFQKEDPVSPTLVALPVLYGVTIAVNLFSVLFTKTELLGFDKLEAWVDILISCGLGLIVAVSVHLLYVRKIRRTLKEEKAGVEDCEKLISTKQSEVPMIDMKRIKQPPVLETIKESVSMENSRNNLHVVDTPTNDADIIKPNTKFNLGVQDPRIQQLKEEAKKKRKSFKKSLSTSSSVKLPPVLQLEKGVVQKATPVQPAEELKEEIRRNFSCPAMKTLQQNADSDVYTIMINRHKSLVTIKRRNLENDKTSIGSENRIKSNGSITSADMDEISIPTMGELPEPFDETEDEEEGLIMTSLLNNNKENVRPSPLASSPPTNVPAAIEEGFRIMLNETNNDVVNIKIDAGEEIAQDNTEVDIVETRENQPMVRKMYGFLQILTACFGAFAHGGNDVSNAIGPLIALYVIYSDNSVKQQTQTPLWLLLYGGVGICAGLWVWGRRVIKTMGQELTELTPSRGFAIELMSAMTVLVASNLGLPVSTTHCKVGAVVSVGWVRSRQAVDWKIFRNIVLAWFVTVPISGGLAAIMFALLRAFAGL